jgi:hypothetical protein
MTTKEFIAERNKGKVYAVDATLREPHEKWEDFIVRAKQNNLGTWMSGEHRFLPTEKNIKNILE